MVDRKIYPELAAHVIDSVNVRDGDAVHISGGAHQREFLEEIGVDVARRGGEPFISAASDRYQRRLLEAASVEALKRTPKIGLAAAQAMDVLVIVEPFSDPAIKRGFEDKLKARSEGRQPITETIYGKPGKRWIYMGWATEGMAKTYGVPLEVLERLVIDSCLIDYGLLKRNCQHVIDKLKGAKHVRVTDWGNCLLQAFNTVEKRVEKMIDLIQEGDSHGTIVWQGMTVKAAGQAMGLAVSPDGRHVVVGIWAGSFAPVVDLQGLKLENDVPLNSRSFQCVAYSPDGRRLYISHYDGDRIMVLDGTTYATIGSISVAAHPKNIVITPDGKYMYMTHEQGKVEIIGLPDGGKVRTLNITASADGMNIAFNHSAR